MAGRRPRGDRSQTTLRAPRDHLEQYKAAAYDAGVPLGDYLAIALAERHGLPVPAYLNPPAARDQRELPLGA